MSTTNEATRVNFLTEMAMRAPRLTVLGLLVIVGVLGAQFPQVRFDNDPENMLAEDEPVRLFHHEVKERYGLYDFVVAGVVNEAHEDGVFNVGTLGRIDRLTRQLMGLRRGADGRPEIVEQDGAGGQAKAWTPDLRPQSGWDRALNAAFRHDPERLFDEEGRGAIVIPEIIAPGLVDNLKQETQGSLKMEYLMERAPATREEAMAIRDDAMGNPLYKDTLVSSDGKAMGVYLPILDKTFSHNIATLVETLTADWPPEDRVFITGLPVAEDTFGVEMLKQMAVSAPLAGVMIFGLLLLFFRRVGLILAPLIVAIMSVVSAMGLLIGLGYPVHIMSSMIAIFLMPIAVADSVHILSEFYDRYPAHRDRRAALKEVMGHLFRPMLFTSLTTMAGFASLALTPIPPVKVFGLHVAFGVGAAWVLSMTLIPAYILLFVRQAALDRIKPPVREGSTAKRSLLDRALPPIGRFAARKAVGVAVGAALLLALAVAGILRINVNDNPVKWFAKDHRIRIADKVLNEHFAGTYTAYLTLESPEASTALATGPSWQEVLASAGLDVAEPAIARWLERSADAPDEARITEAMEVDRTRTESWDALIEAVQYVEPEQASPATLRDAVAGVKEASESDRAKALGMMEALPASTGSDLQESLLDRLEQEAPPRLEEVVRTALVTQHAPAFKRPEVLAWVARLQEDLRVAGVVGKTSSAVDALKKAHYELRRSEPASSEDADLYRIPDDASSVAQVFLQLEGTKKKDSLFHLVSRDYTGANVWVQLPGGDNRDMEKVVARVEQFVSENPPPVALTPAWAGLTYINVIWQQKMVVGMLESLVGSFVVVLGMMVLLFRSPLFGLLSMIPLLFTITLTYGIIGWVGKEYDMPVAVLSALTLGLSVDFAIHFLQRARELSREKSTWAAAAEAMFREPARAITRNALVIALGFTPLLLAPLVPYRTVGLFMMAIMTISWLASLVLLTALGTLWQRRLFSAPTLIKKEVNS
jgi:uncharacterized protein